MLGGVPQRLSELLVGTFGCTYLFNFWKLGAQKHECFWCGRVGGVLTGSINSPPSEGMNNAYGRHSGTQSCETR